MQQRIGLTLVVEVDRDTWDLEYGEQDDLREDVRSYVLTVLQGTAAAESGAIQRAWLR